MTYAERLQFAMDAEKRERKDIAQAAGISVQAVGKILNSPARRGGFFEH